MNARRVRRLRFSLLKRCAPPVLRALVIAHGQSSGQADRAPALLHEVKKGPREARSGAPCPKPRHGRMFMFAFRCVTNRCSDLSNSMSS
jgi:hypothetical protein